MSTSTRASTSISSSSTNKEQGSSLPELVQDPRPGDRPGRNRSARKNHSFPVSQPDRTRQAGGQETLRDFFRVMQNWFEETE